MPYSYPRGCRSCFLPVCVLRCKSLLKTCFFPNLALDCLQIYTVGYKPKFCFASGFCVYRIYSDIAYVACYARKVFIGHRNNRKISRKKNLLGHVLNMQSVANCSTPVNLCNRSSAMILPPWKHHTQKSAYST